jgi:adenylyltransferase/sulfurtransferase
MTEQDIANLDRYSRQILFAPIGEDGQRRLMQSRVTLVGCGALGTVIAQTLVRAGVGFLRICDRDYIEPNNLQRQVLFDEDDIAQNLPKAIAAGRKLARVNSRVELDAVITDVNRTNIERLVDGADLILDGTDNFETRYLINDVSIKSGVPWIYGAVIGATGLMMPILPGEGPCLRCVFESAPPPEMSPTCDTAGVIAPAVNVVASFQSTEAIKLLAGKREAINRSLTSIDVWSGRVSVLNVGEVREPNTCICCGRREFEYLTGKAGSTIITLCGRDAVQITPSPDQARKVDLKAIAAKLEPVAKGTVERGEYMLRATVEGYTFSVFPDGRAIIKGIHNPDVARSVFAKYIGQ